MIKRIFAWLHLSSEEREVRLMSDPIYALLRREVTRVGHLYEHKPLSELQRADEELSFSETIEGVTISFNCHCVEQLKNGDVVFCIDACAEPNRTGRQPSYQFCKTTRGEVYY
jgi:hypothetical protein